MRTWGRLISLGALHSLHLPPSDGHIRKDAGQPMRTSASTSQHREAQLRAFLTSEKKELPKMSGEAVTSQ